MLWELIRTGHLPAWDWLYFAVLWSAAIVGLGALMVIRKTEWHREG